MSSEAIARVADFQQGRVIDRESKICTSQIL